MKTNILLVYISIFLLQSCAMSEQKRKENEEKSKKLIEETRAFLAQDSINTIEQDKAFGDILFGISENSYNNLKEIFLNKSKDGYVVDKRGYSRDSYLLGNYRFSYIAASFHNDSLYEVIFFGQPEVEYDYYDFKMKKQYNTLFSILRVKYGEPFYSNFPNRSSLVKDDTIDLCTWLIKKKRVQIEIYFDGEYATLWLRIFLPEIKEMVDKEQEMKDRVLKREREMKEFETAKKAAEIL